MNRPDTFDAYDPEAPLRAAARRLGVAFIDADEAQHLIAVGPAAPPSVLRSGRSCRVTDTRSVRVFTLSAPGARDIAALSALVDHSPEALQGLAFATTRTIRTLLRDRARPALLRLAIDGLSHRFPAYSARLTLMPAQTTALVVCGAALALSVFAFPLVSAILINILAAIIFLIAMIARIAAATLRMGAPLPVPYAEDNLPVYSVLVPLYREAEGIAGLIEALDRLDYPRRLLDIKLIVEEDDPETRAALADLNPGAPYEVIVVPKAAPRTKPKALAYALPLARGDHVVIYDAEDRPDPLQLRIALAAFAKGPERLACVQAKLVIDNRGESFLTRQFFCEYAALFEVFLPALALFGLPIPLGGTSNHFRRDALVAVGGWDPFNVTEDADLGLRLARAGWKVDVIDSVTHEEAPAGIGAWSGQRSRWFKGWLQTWLVHMRQPLTLLGEIGPAGFITFQVVSIIAVISALLHPFFFLVSLGVFSALLADPEVLIGLSFGSHALIALNMTVFLIGWAGTLAIALAGVERRGAAIRPGDLALLPLYWICLSWGAWRAVYDLILFPHRWVKTPHGSQKRQIISGDYKTTPQSDRATGLTAGKPFLSSSGKGGWSG
ncbi:MAG: glycosyltransferase [Hyphomicrobiaceae bacterium]|nr:glycosyltransferase [Hyphomicrobiaceae bacterium]